MATKKKKSPFYFFIVSFKTGTDLVTQIQATGTQTSDSPWLHSCLQKAFGLFKLPFGHIKSIVIFTMLSY